MDRVSLFWRSARGLVILAAMMASVLFLSAGTMRWLAGWIFVATVTAFFATMTGVMLAISPDLVERRMRAGPNAESRCAQKIVQTINAVISVGLLVIGGLDHRFGWSAFSLPTILWGYALVLAGCAGMLLTFRANPFGASTIEIVPGQVLADRGLYAIVRHPMYSAAIVFLLGAGLALGSVWTALLSILLIPTLALRALDEERLLALSLEGYPAYQAQVRWRLLPGVW